MTQASTNSTFHMQTNQIDNAPQVEANSVEFLNGTPTDLSTNPKRIWIDQTTEELRFTTDGVDIHTIAQRSGLASQMLINGNFDVWQRGTTIVAGAAAIYTADRWLLYREGLITGSQVLRAASTQINGQNFFAQVGRVPSDANAGDVVFAQALDSDTSIKFRSGRVTISFQARAINLADFSSPGKVLRVRVLSGTGQNQNAAGVITGSTTLLDQTVVLTNVFQRFSVTTASIVASAATQLFVYFSYTPTGVAPANTNDNFGIAQVQLSATPVAIPFEPRRASDVLQDCQAYYFKTYNQEIAPGTNSTLGLFQWVAATTNQSHAVGTIQFPTTMRTTPTVTLYASDGTINSITNQTAITTIAGQATGQGSGAVTVRPTTGGTFAAIDRLSCHIVADAEM